jgi:hypothetical protein
MHASVAVKPLACPREQPDGDEDCVNRAYAVVDDFLSPQEHLDLWVAFQDAVRTPGRVHDWSRGYQRSSGGDVHDAGDSPPRAPSLREDTTGSPPLPPALQVFSEKLFALVTGDGPPLAIAPWTGFSLGTWTYRPGTGLGWHSDTGWLAGYIYYLHPVWRSNWGGELLVATEDDDAPSGAKSIARSAVHSAPAPAASGGTGDAAESVCRTGGVFIYPRPNRLVLLRGGTLHCIKKVETAAGDSSRTSLSGFFFNTDSGNASTPAT